jgi:hypothetical protein
VIQSVAVDLIPDFTEAPWTLLENMRGSRTIWLVFHRGFCWLEAREAGILTLIGSFHAMSGARWSNEL